MGRILCMIFLLFLVKSEIRKPALTDMSAEMDFISMELVLDRVPLYGGRDWWKNKVRFSLNLVNEANYPSFVQPFDYYEIFDLSHQLEISADSIHGNLSFSLPGERGNFSFRVEAAVQGDSIVGQFKELSRDTVGESSLVYGSFRETPMIPPKFSTSTLGEPGLPYLIENDLFKHMDGFHPGKKPGSDKEYTQRVNPQLLHHNDPKKVTLIIQEAIDRCHQIGGGKIILPAGRYYAGALQIKSGVNLYLEKGCELVASPDPSHYPDGFFIYFKNASRCGITGPGCIDGNGMQWIDTLRMEYPHRKDAKRLYWKKLEIPFWPTVFAHESRDIYFCGFEIKNSPSWHLGAMGCDVIEITGLAIRTPLNLVRSDGIDLIGCSNVRIRNCRITCGDDAIVIKGHRYWKDLENKLPCKHISVENCVITTSCNGFKTGTDTQCDIIDLKFRNSIIWNNPKSDLRATSGISLTAVDGGEVSEVEIDSIRIMNTHTPIFLRLGKRNRDQPSGISKLTGIRISNIRVEGTDEPISIHGLPDRRIGMVQLTNLSGWSICNHKGIFPEYVPLKPEVYPNADRFGIIPAWGIYARYTDTLWIQNLHMENRTSDQRPPVLLEAVSESNMKNVELINL